MPEVEVGTKRSTDNYEYGDVDQYKRSRPGGIKLRQLLVGKYCGFVIGKGGENLARLRNEYNVEIDMPSTRTVDRVFNVDGALDDCVNVAKEILAGCTQAPYPVGQKCAFEMNLLVNTDSVGMVIGKGGEKIKQIRDESDSKLKVYQECLPNSNERVVAIGGEDENQVIKALTLILNVLKDAPRSPAIYYDPSNKPSEIMCGGITGSGGMPMPGGVSNAWGAGGDRQDTNNFDFLQLPTVTEITVPNDMCGAIIGKAGIRIREIRSTSGAKIDFTEADRETNRDRIITISGTQQQVTVAEQLMSQCIRNRTN